MKVYRILAVLAALAALTVAAAVPAAASVNGNASGGLFFQDFCGGGADPPPSFEPFPDTAGSVVLHNDGATMNVGYHLRNAPPDTVYSIRLYAVEDPSAGASPVNCSVVSQVGTVTTDAQGNANANFQGVVNPDPFAPGGYYTFSIGDGIVTYQAAVESVVISP